HSTSSLVHPSCTVAHRHPHSFPTRRSSDLKDRTSPARPRGQALPPGRPGPARQGVPYGSAASFPGRMPTLAIDRPVPPTGGAGRSEEHTSELQSRENLVCRLLLEKKKKKDK